MCVPVQMIFVYRKIGTTTNDSAMVFGMSFVSLLLWSSTKVAALDRLSPMESDELLYKCIDPPRRRRREKSNAYAVMMGPIAEDRRYAKWLYPILAVRRALVQAGSTADLLVLAAVVEEATMTPEEEGILKAQDVRVRYVPAPQGLRGFHLGHYKLWAWQHTEYDRIQLLDADILPLVNMDLFFDLDYADFVGCPGRQSVVNAGWILLKPSCRHFKGLVTLLWKRGRLEKWDPHLGWGVPLPSWRNAMGHMMKPGHDFFDAKGNQGHMYSYFRYYAQDIALIYSDHLEGVRPGGSSDDVYTPHFESQWTVLADRHDADLVYKNGFPCPFTSDTYLPLAYHHFTGVVKPWTRYDPSNPRYQQWYAVLRDIGIDVRTTIFHNQTSSSSGSSAVVGGTKKKKKRWTSTTTT